ncbi:PDZ domain-containing protein [Streptomyces sp. NPDC001027]|uniref:PDZ domain-containing protein n=1 Tax=Streptomyces sp. NPDC001027 TaxID=3154771 RepID=UPI0033286A67
MEQTALRPKPLPGQDPDGAAPPSGPGRRPHTARRGGRGPTTTLVAGLLAGTVLVLSGVGLGAVGATVVGMSRLAELQRQAELAGRAASQVPTGRPETSVRTREAGAAETAGTAGRSGAGRAPARDRPGASEAAAGTGASAGAAGSSRDAGASLGLEAVDARGTGAEIVAVHVPGPGFTAGLVRGDVMLTFGGAEIDSAADLARAVDRARPGAHVEVTVRRRGGGHRTTTVVPGIVT